MTKAAIYNTNMQIVSDSYAIHGDDFAALERKARKIAKAGTECCIRWTRDNDGQSGYYGPQGASITAYWYKPNA